MFLILLICFLNCHCFWFCKFVLHLTATVVLAVQWSGSCHVCALQLQLHPSPHHKGYLVEYLWIHDWMNGINVFFVVWSRLHKPGPCHNKGRDKTKPSLPQMQINGWFDDIWWRIRWKSLPSNHKNYIYTNRGLAWSDWETIHS